MNKIASRTWYVTKTYSRDDVGVMFTDCGEANCADA